MSETVNLPHETTVRRMAAALETIAEAAKPAADEFVRFNRPQMLTETERQQAQNNIRAVSKKVLSGVLSQANTQTFDAIGFSLKKQGAVCTLHCTAQTKEVLTGSCTIGTIPVSFRPNADQNGAVFVSDNQSTAMMRIDSHGVMTVSIGAPIQAHSRIIMCAAWIMEVE